VNPVAALELRGIRRRFGPVEALRGADFVLREGEVHALLGENGAGKSTLMHVAFGLVRADEGVVRVRGREVRLTRPDDAKALGIGMVHQHFTSIPALTVAENLRLARGRRRRGQPAPGRAPDAVRQARAVLEEGLDPAAQAGDLSVSQKQRLEILQSLAASADILLLDEPTAVLAPSEVSELLKLLRKFSADGGSVVLITHKLDEVFAAADRVTVLRRGAVTFSGGLEGRTRGDLAAAMIGGPAGPGPGGPGAPDLPAAEAPGASLRVGGPAAGATTPPGPGGRSGRPLVVIPGGGGVAPVAIHAGDIVGIAAVEGNGQRELLRGLASLGERPPGTEVAGPVAFIPEDRTTEGLVPGFSLTENLVLGLPGDPRWRDGPWIRWPAARRRMADLLAEHEIRAPGPAAPAGSLSGGNQQKVILARALDAQPLVVVAENPTRGLDVRATLFVHDRLRRTAAAGAAVLVYSTDLDEVLALATRVLVVWRGRVREVPAGTGRDRVGAMMLGVDG
jgi:general nucleoside transport system ATP-binding protein